jgi:hypothetical protein
MKILEQEVLFNFMTQEAFTTIQNAKAAYINPPNSVANFVLILGVLALIVYGLNRSRRK